jgi:hypothetical protein
LEPIEPACSAKRRDRDGFGGPPHQSPAADTLVDPSADGAKPPGIHEGGAGSRDFPDDFLNVI